MVTKSSKDTSSSEDKPNTSLADFLKSDKTDTSSKDVAKKDEGSDPVLVDDETYAEPVKTEATKKPEDDTPDHLVSDVDKVHNYKNLEKGTFNDQVDTKEGVTGQVVPITDTNAVHTGITDNYPNDFKVPEEYPPNESALTSRQVTERFYAAPSEYDDKGLAIKEKDVVQVNPKTGDIDRDVHKNNDK